MILAQEFVIYLLDGMVKSGNKLLAYDRKYLPLKVKIIPYKKNHLFLQEHFYCLRNIFTTRHRNDLLSQENLCSQEEMDALLQSHG